jgi:hypothetical protein
VNGLQTVLGLTSVVSANHGFRVMKNTGELNKGSTEKEEVLLKFPYRCLTQGVHGQWKRVYSLEQKRPLLQHQREASRTADEEIQVAGTVPTLEEAASSRRRKMIHDVHSWGDSFLL